MINLFIYRSGSESVEQSGSISDIPQLLDDKDVVFWLDLEAPSEADDHILLDVFKFHPLTVEDCRANRHSPKIEEFPGYIYYILHAVKTDASPDHFNTIELDGYLGDNESILHLKRGVLRLRRISARQLDVIYRMSHGQFALISGPVLPFYRDIYDHIGRVTDLAENYRDLITGALDAYLSVVSNRLNEIMKVLTIFSAIMAVMIAITTGMLLMFWKRGWIGKQRG